MYSSAQVRVARRHAFLCTQLQPLTLSAGLRLFNHSSAKMLTMLQAEDHRRYEAHDGGECQAHSGSEREVRSVRLEGDGVRGPREVEDG